MANRGRFEGGGLGSLGAAFPEALRKMAEQSPTRIKALQRGDVVWLTLAQSLSSKNSSDPREFKNRPFIVLNEKITYRADANGHCAEPVSLLGVDGTSQKFFVEDRPHVKFQIPGEFKQTFALLDSVRTVTCRDCSLEPAYRLTQDEINGLHSGLDQVLQPERGFFSNWFNRRIMPGQIWGTRTIVDKQPSPALVLLRRGKFIAPSELNNHNTPPSSPVVRKAATPYLIASFKGAAQVTTLRGIGWDSIEIMAVHENAFVSQQGQLTSETVGILLNNLRDRVGLSPIAYRTPEIKSLINFFPWLFGSRALRMV